MAAALKKTGGKADFQPVETPAPSIAKIAAEELNPVASPARQLQSSLEKELEQDKPSKSEVVIGLIVGICGASWITGILIYATL